VDVIERYHGVRHKVQNSVLSHNLNTVLLDSCGSREHNVAKYNAVGRKIGLALEAEKRRVFDIVTLVTSTFDELRLGDGYGLSEELNNEIEAVVSKVDDDASSRGTFSGSPT